MTDVFLSRPDPTTAEGTAERGTSVAAPSPFTPIGDDAFLRESLNEVAA